MSSMYRQAALDARHLEKLGVTLDLGSRLPGVAACLLICVAAAAAWFAGQVEYGRRITVTGLIDQHQATEVIASDIGEISELNVAEGGHVREGDVIARLKLPAGNRDLEPVLNELEVQRARLVEQRLAVDGAHRDQRLSLMRQLDSSGQQLPLLDSDLALQTEKVGHLAEHLERTRVLREEGLMSNLDWISFRTGLISEQQKRNQLEQQRLQLAAQMDTTRAELRQLDNRTQERSAAIEVQLSQVRKEREMLLAERSRPIVAPAPGIVSRLDVRAGDAVVPGQSLLHISAPASPLAALTASLMVPADAAPRLERGQQIELIVDALPVERFGRLPATVIQLAPHAVTAQDSARYFPARVAIDAERAETFAGGDLLPGMTIRTHVRADRKRIVDWLLDPITKLFGHVSS